MQCCGSLNSMQRCNRSILVATLTLRRAYEAGEIDGGMRRYAHVLVILNGGQAGIDLFIHKHPIMFEKVKLGNPMDCIKYVPHSRRYNGFVDQEQSSLLREHCFG